MLTLLFTRSPINSSGLIDLVDLEDAFYLKWHHAIGGDSQNKSKFIIILKISMCLKHYLLQNFQFQCPNLIGSYQMTKRGDNMLKFPLSCL